MPRWRKVLVYELDGNFLLLTSFFLLHYVWFRMMLYQSIFGEASELIAKRHEKMESFCELECMSNGISKWINIYSIFYYCSKSSLLKVGNGWIWFVLISLRSMPLISFPQMNFIKCLLDQKKKKTVNALFSLAVGEIAVGFFGPMDFCIVSWYFSK